MPCIAEWKSMELKKRTLTLSNLTNSVEIKIKACLVFFVLSVLLLVILLTHAWGWSPLGMITVISLICYPLCWLAWKVWRFWSSSLMRLTTYTQSLVMGESGVLPARQGHSALIDDLSREIGLLDQKSTEGSPHSQSLSVLFGQLFEDLPIAIVVFDSNKSVTYVNKAAYEISDISLLQGMTASELGFSEKNNQIRHPALELSWRCQSSYLTYMNQSACLFTAIDISNELKQSEQAVQSNLVRVLSHELRNTLTPMSSMAETILTMNNWDEAQLRKVFERIKARADGLLTFVHRFAEVAKIPEPKKERFDIETLLEQTWVLLSEKDSLVFSGQHTCTADPQLMAQVLMNLVKNAIESADGQGVEIKINYHQAANLQCLSVEDNSTGFSNIDNAITPLYTTKTNGAGIGLAFVETVLSKHGGKVRLSNTPNSGAKVELTWPLQG